MVRAHDALVSDPVIFSGSANVSLATEIARLIGVPLGKRSVHRFPDGEISITIEQTIRKREVYIIQPTSAPVDENLMELLAFADACRRASADRIVAVIPYFGYARSDKRLRRREPITASMVADLLQAVGVTSVITLDVHAPQIEGFFRIPLDDLTATALLASAAREHLASDAVVVSPDAGRVRTATEFAQRLRTAVVLMHKRRESDFETAVTHIVGDVRGRACLVVDDMISTGGTIAETVAALRHAGADREIVVAATHGLFIAGAREKLRSVESIIVTDSIEQTGESWPQRRVVSVAPLFANAIQRIASDGSLAWAQSDEGHR